MLTLRKKSVSLFAETIFTYRLHNNSLHCTHERNNYIDKSKATLKIIHITLYVSFFAQYQHTTQLHVTVQKQTTTNVFQFYKV